MLKPGAILNRLYEHLEDAAATRRIADLRIGLSYVCVLLDSGKAGLAAVFPQMANKGCTILKEAGMYAGSVSTKSLRYLVDGQNPLYRSIGLATANALAAVPENASEDREATTYFNLRPGDQVAMVGLFSPLVERIRATGATLTVIEKNPQRIDLLSPEETAETLKNCDVALITATTLINHTFEETIRLLGRPRVVALIGPSTPLVPEIFRDTPVTHLGGSVVQNTDRVMQMISEGGGTPALRPFLRFANLML